MSLVSTFGSFTTARLGIYVAQKGLSVTGNNISNINTVGYTRQALDQVSLKTGGSDRYRSHFDVHVGNGVLATGVSQLRDPYLDIRYRSEMSSVGAMDAKLAGLENIAAILDEVGDGENGGDGILEAQLGELRKSLENLSIHAGQEEYDAQVREAAATLCSLFNSYSSELTELQNNTITQLETEVDTVNEILTNIRNLNASIRKSEIHGDNALEMRDERNMLIDQLSEYMKIDVVYTMEDVGAGHMVEKLTIKLGNANPDPNVHTDTAALVDGVYATQLQIDQVPQPNPNYNAAVADPADPAFGQYLTAAGAGTNDAALANMVNNENYRMTLSELRDSKNRVMEIRDAANNVTLSQPVALDDNDLYGAIQSIREILTEKGEFSSTADIAMDEKAATKRGIPYYQRALDLLANKMATMFNAANNKQNSDGTANPDAGNLFSNSGDADATTNPIITAANISVSHSWAVGDVHIVRSYEVDSATGEIPSTKNDNILHVITMMDTKENYLPSEIGAESTIPMFNGTFQEMLTNIGPVLGNDINSTSVMLNTFYNASVELDSSRDGVSGVDLNDEAMNLIQYQKSYSAACRLITTLDEALDKLINGTGVVGR